MISALRRPRDLTASLCRRIEASWERNFKDGSLTDLRSAVRSLPLVVQCAARIHDKREAGGSLLFGVDGPALFGGVERRFALVARQQLKVLLFSPTGVLDVAGELIDCPSAPIHPGQRWTRIVWEGPPFSRDWF